MKKFAFLAFALMLAVAPAFADTIFVPFFRDGFESGNNQGFISVQNTSGADTTVTIIYTASSNSVVQAPATFFLGAGASIGWRPVNTGSEGTGVSVPDMTVHAGFPGLTAAGSASISAPVKLVGRYLERNLVTGLTAMFVLPN